MKISKRLKKTVAANKSVVGLCQKVKELEDSGEYIQAAELLGHWWQGLGIRPLVEKLPASQRASVLVRVGVLTGWLGSMQQIAGAQEKAKDLISEAANLFEAIHDWENWAEARGDLAMCYWREGAFDEARVIFEDVLTSGLSLSPEVRGKTLLRFANVEISSGHYEKATYLINKATLLIENDGNSLLRAKLYFNRALILRCRGEEENNTYLLMSALEDYGLANAQYRKAGHLLYSAHVENNLGRLYLSLENYKSAHSHLNKALNLYIDLKDRSRAASVYENMALVFISEAKLNDAELAARTSVNILRTGGEQAILAESLTTLGVVLSRQGNFTEAVHSFVEARDVALLAGDRESAGNAVLTQMEELQNDLSLPVFKSLYLEADELLKDSPRMSVLLRLQKIAKRLFSHSKNESFNAQDLAEAVYKAIKRIAEENKFSLSGADTNATLIAETAELKNEERSIGIEVRLRHSDNKISISAKPELPESSIKESPKRRDEFIERLKNCRSGKKGFSQYEEICRDALEYIFEGRLEYCEYTRNKTQRRDINFKNLLKSDFFVRIASVYNAYFIIFDCKNYSALLNKNAVDSIAKYPGKALGWFAVLISREGADNRVIETQRRYYSEENKIILSINDADLIEMISKKERGESPEDLLEKRLDRFLLQY